jgi:N utilization substance protein A
LNEGPFSDWEADFFKKMTILSKTCFGNKIVILRAKPEGSRPKTATAVICGILRSVQNDIMTLPPFLSAIEQICEEKGIPREKVIEAIEMALAAAYKKDYGKKGQNIKAKFNPETGEMVFSQVKLVVDESMLKPEEEIAETELSDEDKPGTETQPEPGEEILPDEEKKIRFNPERHIMLEEAQRTNKKIKPGEEIEFPLETRGDYGRIAAQTAKQVIIQRIREAEREAVYDEYKEKENQVVSGIVQRIEGRNVFLDIGKTTGVLFPEEQIPGERYRMGQRIKVFIASAQKDSRGPNIILSRTHPKMVSQLFALEVPEISAGTVVIKSIAREAGSRTKIAVSSTEERVDPIGSMIGQKGTRVQAVINELSGEKIDIIEWSENPAKFIASSLSPAKVIDIKINQGENRAEAFVPEDQLSLAIGVKGQNVRLAAKLTGWKIDIVSQEASKKAKDEKEEKEKAEEEKEKKPAKKEKKTVKKSAKKETKTAKKEKKEKTKKPARSKKKKEE